jgi:hypothetical protein
MTPTGWRVICDCCSSSSTRRTSAFRLNIPVNESITTSPRNRISDRMRTVWIDRSNPRPRAGEERKEAGIPSFE